MQTALALLACSLPLSAVSAAETYNVDPSHTSATFSFNHLGLSTFYGKFATVNGTITLDREKRQGNADITFDAAGIVTGVPKLDEHLRSSDFFDVKKYPQITFRGKSFKFNGDVLSEVSGDLTVRDVTRPVTLKVTSFNCKEHPMMKVPACGADAETVIKRSEFGVGAYVPAVSDEIPLRINIEAVRK